MLRRPAARDGFRGELARIRTFCGRPLMGATPHLISRGKRDILRYRGYFMRTLRTCLTLLAAVALAIPAMGQSVISTHSGLIYYFDGAAYVDNQPLESHMGEFQSVPQGAQLRTGQGHAEVLLTPGVFLRLGDNSAIRMLSNDLADTRVELQTGSAIVDSSEPIPAQPSR